jgi:hypothetical protein
VQVTWINVTYVPHPTPTVPINPTPTVPIIFSGISFTGYVNDAQNEFIIPGAQIQLIYGAFTQTVVSDYYGSYTIYGGAVQQNTSMSITTTKSGYTTDTVIFVPAMGSHNLNISLIYYPFDTLYLYGIVRCLPYYTPVQGATIEVQPGAGTNPQISSMTGFYLMNGYKSNGGQDHLIITIKPGFDTNISRLRIGAP